MQTPNPRKQKELGRSIDKKSVNRHWKVQQKWSVQLRGCRAKFQQNEVLARSLVCLETSRKHYGDVLETLYVPMEVWYASFLRQPLPRQGLRLTMLVLPGPHPGGGGRKN